MSHLTLDARAILAYLNELGYRNISAEQLREFMKDLRKLIKYEERLGTNANKDDYFNSLFQRTTASFRAKKDKENAVANVKSKSGKNNTALEEKKSPRLEQKKSSSEQKKSGKDKASEQKKEKKKAAIFLPPQSSEPIPVPPPPPMKLMQGSTAVSQRKVLGEVSAEQNRQVLKKPKNWFSFSDDDDDNDDGKSKTRKPTTFLFSRENRNKDRTSRSKSPKSARITEKLLDDLKQPLWEGQSISSRSRSHSTGRNRPEPSAKALSTGGIHKKRRSQSSDRPSDFRTYTARSLGAMVPQPRFNRGNRSGVNDPVKLYHYYQREWKYFEKQIPGVLTRADIRWQIRQKLLDPQ